jgi:hypothetical protein
MVEEKSEDEQVVVIEPEIIMVEEDIKEEN